jgi:predicted nucleic acid-binding protein
MRVYDFAGRDELWEAAELMERYGDTPMDYADATLVLLAEALDLRSILTLDRHGFSAYRTPTRKSFKLVLEQQPSR